MNRENMEKWVEALETYKGERAHFTLLDHEGNMCAMGIGLKTAGLMPNLPSFQSWDMPPIVTAFESWTGLPRTHKSLDVSLIPDATDTRSVTRANDGAMQDAWTIAQRLRETYLKEES